MKILFTSDIHGATLLWEKAIIHSKLEKVDLLIIAGDLAGKTLLPIMKAGSNYETNYDNKELIFASEKEVRDFQKYHQKTGLYSTIMEPDELEKCKVDKNYLEDLFDKIIIKHLGDMIDQLKSSGLLEESAVLISPGNDDSLDIDKELKKRNGEIIFGSDNVIEFEDINLVNFNAVPISPWNTHRELTEAEIYTNLDKIICSVSGNKESIYNIHCPPYGTRIDLAPELKNLKPVVEAGEIKYINIGSKSVRKIIEKYQPLCTFHGHVHESPGKSSIGRTICFNPGSEYEKGVFRGEFVEISNNSLLTDKLIID